MQHRFAEGEVVVGVFRKHWIEWAGKAAIGVAVLVVVGVGMTLVLPSGWKPVPWPAAVMVGYGYWRYLHREWDNDVFIVTNQRIIDRSGVGRAAVTSYPIQSIDQLEAFSNRTVLKPLRHGSVRFDRTGRDGLVSFDRLRDPIGFEGAFFTARSRPRYVDMKEVDRLTNLELLEVLMRRGVLSPAEFKNLADGGSLSRDERPM